MVTMEQGADPRAEERVGTVLDEKWTLEHLIGSGGMAAVYAAKHRNGARSAVKILHPELARVSEIRERFLREGYAANRVEHRGVVRVLDDDIVKSGPDEGSAYLVMELLEGESLHERMERPPKLGERELLELMDAVLDVLEAAHAHGVIHRDLKPENVFLARDPDVEGVRVKVLDFGLARLSESATVTTAGIALGTPSFMSPEQAAGRTDEIDGRTDIFALGATIFRIATGRRIHNADNMVQLVSLMATVPAPPVRTVNPELSERFARVVDRAIAFDRAERYPTAAAMRADVLAALETRATAVSLLQVIPFSRRSFSSFGSRPEDVKNFSLPRITERGVTSDVREAAFFVKNSESALPDSERAPSEGAESRVEQLASVVMARRSLVPWLVIAAVLAVGGWMFGPTLKSELVRRSAQGPQASDSIGAPPSQAGDLEHADASTSLLRDVSDASAGAPKGAPSGKTTDSTSSAAARSTLDDDAGALVTADTGARRVTSPRTADGQGQGAGSTRALAATRPPSPTTTPTRATKPPAKKPPPPKKSSPQPQSQQRRR